MEMYSTFDYTKSDLQVVPDDGYNSPSPSPCYNYDSAKSPANSITSTVDSAFDELAEVIPELSDTEYYPESSFKNYHNMANLSSYGSPMGGDISLQMKEESIRKSPNMYEAASPYISDSEHEEAMSPSSNLIQAVEQASMKRSYPRWQTNTINLLDLRQEEPPAKRVMTESQAIAAYSTLLYARGQIEEEKPVFLPQLNEDSGISMSSFGSQSSNVAKTRNAANSSSNDQPLLSLDDNLLKSKFSVLAEYLNAESAQSCLQNKPVCEPVQIKVEEPETVVAENNDFIGTKEADEACDTFQSIESANLMMTQWIANILQNQANQASVPANQNMPQRHQSAEVKQPQQKPNQQLTFAELCKKASPKAPGVMFFNIDSSEKKEEVKPAVEKRVKVEMILPADPLEMVRNWKGAAKPKRPNLMSPSSKPRLYNFLLELLSDPSSKCIEWLNEEQGIFKFINSGEVARRWGQRKNKPNMKYENFARSLRTYVAKGILTKPRNKLVYQFMPNFH